MVRINLIKGKYLMDQHLNAEHVEILMLLGSTRNWTYDINKIPKRYCLGKGHINFFRNKLIYLKKRFESLQTEMIRRGYQVKAVYPDLSLYDLRLLNDWEPKDDDYNTIIDRLVWKLSIKPEYYTYKGINYTLARQVEWVDKGRNDK